MCGCFMVGYDTNQITPIPYLPPMAPLNLTLSSSNLKPSNPLVANQNNYSTYDVVPSVKPIPRILRSIQQISCLTHQIQHCDFKSNGQKVKPKAPTSPGSNNHYSFYPSSLTPTKTKLCFPFQLFAVSLHSFSPHFISLYCFHSFPLLLCFLFLSILWFLASMAEKGKGKLFPEDISSLEKAFAAKLALPLPAAKEAVLDDDVWEELEREGKKLLAIKILSPDHISFGLAHEAIFKAISRVTTLFKLQRSKDLTFVALFDIEKDLLSFLYRSPWIVLKNRLLLLKRIDHLAVGALTRFSDATIWLHLANIPEGIRENTKALNALVECAGSLVGKVLVQGNGDEKIVRAKISVPTEKPLNVFAVVKKRRTGECLRFLCTYDKMGILCLKCGKLGHWQGECTVADAHIIPTNRFAYLVAKPFKAYYSPLITAESSNNSGRRNFGQIAAGIARNLSPELSSGGEEQPEREEHQIMLEGHSNEIRDNGQTARLSDSAASDYDPSEESAEKESLPSEGGQIASIDRTGRIRNSGLTLDASKRASREDSFGGKSMTFSINKDFLQTLACGPKSTSFIFESVGTSSRLQSPHLDQVSGAQFQQMGSPPQAPPGFEHPIFFGPSGFQQPIFFGPDPRAGPGRGRGRGRGRARGPKRIFSNVPKGPGPEWNLRPSRNGLVLIPAADESPTANGEGISISESLESGEYRPLQADGGGVDSLDVGGNIGNAAGSIDGEVAGVRRRQVSTESLQPALKRRRPEEF